MKSYSFEPLTYQEEYTLDVEPPDSQGDMFLALTTREKHSKFLDQEGMFFSREGIKELIDVLRQVLKDNPK
jgi:hypothetical protein